VDNELDAEVAARLRAVDQRFTANRRAVVEVLDRAEHPVSMAQILDSDRTLAQSSVYRNLLVLEEAGAVRRVVTDGTHARYELAEDLTDHHHHLVCLDCGSVEDVPATTALESSVHRAVDDIDQATGFRTHHHRLDLVGVCRRCRGSDGRG